MAFPNRHGFRGAVTSAEPAGMEQVKAKTEACIVCGRDGEIIISRNGFNKWIKDTFIQDAFPELTEGQREQLLSGIHPDCFQRYFSEDDES